MKIVWNILGVFVVVSLASLVVLPGVLYGIGSDDAALGIAVVGAICFAVAFHILGVGGSGSSAKVDFIGSSIVYLLIVSLVYYPVRGIKAAFDRYPVETVVVASAALILTGRFVYKRRVKNSILAEQARVGQVQRIMEERRAARMEEARRKKAERARLEREAELAAAERERRWREAEERERARKEALVQQIGESADRMGILDRMSGAQFEQFMEKFLSVQGYYVTRLAGAGDQGVDLLLDQDGRRIAVQLKRHARPLGNRPVQEVLAGRFVHKADEAWVVTTSSFTRGGLEAARHTNVRLIDGRELSEWMREVGEELDDIALR